MKTPKSSQSHRESETICTRNNNYLWLLLFIGAPVMCQAPGKHGAGLSHCPLHKAGPRFREGASLAQVVMQKVTELEFEVKSASCHNLSFESLFLLLWDFCAHQRLWVQTRRGLQLAGGVRVPCLYSLGPCQAGFHLSAFLSLRGSFWPLDLLCPCSGQSEGLANYIPINDFQELVYKSPASPPPLGDSSPSVL